MSLVKRLSLSWRSVIISHLSRLQRAREEAVKTFADTALGEGAKKKYPKVTLAKMAASAAQKESANTKDGTKRESKVQRSKAAAVEAFGGASLDELPLKKKTKL